jgi:hypothetical protein
MRSWVEIRHPPSWPACYCSTAGRVRSASLVFAAAVLNDWCLNFRPKAQAAKKPTDDRRRPHRAGNLGEIV